MFGETYASPEDRLLQSTDDVYPPERDVLDWQ